MGKCDNFHTLAERFEGTVGSIVSTLSGITDNALQGMKTAALARVSRLRRGGEVEVPDNQNILNVCSCQDLFLLLEIHQNWVDISLLEQLVKASGSTAAAAILTEYKEAHHRVISKAFAWQVDSSTVGTCPRPDTNSCILQMVFKTDNMLLKEVLACKVFLYYRFGVQPETIEYISAVIGNSLVVTWLVSRHTGLRIVNQCKSPPVLAALQEMEVLAVRLRYPGYSVEVNVSVVNFFFGGGGLIQTWHKCECACKLV